MMTSPTRAQLNSILESAILAPSADNNHRVRFKITDGGLDITYTEGLPALGGYKRILSLLSLGALLENLIIAARHSGMHAEPALFPDGSDSSLLLRIRWRAGNGAPDSLWEVIPQRHTNRRMFFHGPKFSSGEQARMDQAGGALPGCSLTWLDEPSLRSRALRLMRLAEGERFRNQLLHQELFSAIRFDVGWQQTCSEGLPPGSLEVEPPLRPAFALLRHWANMRRANLLGMHRLLGWRAADLPCRFSPHLAVIGVDSATDQTVLAAGRSFQRIWLTATQLGYVLQPLPAAALYALPGAPQEGIPAELQHRLEHAWKTILPGKIPVALCRIGRARPATVATGRKPVEHYISD